MASFSSRCADLLRETGSAYFRRLISRLLVPFALLPAWHACPPAACGADPMPYYGDANMHIALSQDEIIVCSMRLSGETNRPSASFTSSHTSRGVRQENEDSHSLVAFNTKTGKVAWRRRTQNWIFAMEAGSKGEIFFIDASNLYRCRLSDGSTIDTLDLGSLKWPSFEAPEERTPDTIRRLRETLAEPDLKEEAKAVFEVRLKRIEQSGGMKTYFKYYNLILTPYTMFVWRYVSCQELDQVRMCIMQWVAADRNTREVRLSGTEEEYVGRLSEDRVILGDGSEDSRLMLVEKGKMRVIGSAFLQGKKPWCLLTTFPPPEATAICHNSQCLIEFRQATFDHTWATMLGCAVYNGANDTFSWIAPQWKPAGQIGWVLHGSNVVQYISSCGGSTNAITLGMESYDMQGTRIAHRDLAWEDNRRSLAFRGKTSRGDLVFSDTAYYGVPEAWGGADIMTVTGSVMVVEVPSLALKARYNVTDGESPQRQISLRMLTQTNQVLQLFGSRYGFKMEKETQPHSFVIRALDVYSGKELWRMREDVTIIGRRSP